MIFFADAQKVALFIEGLDVAVDKLDIILADLDKVRLNGVAKVNARGSLDFDILGAVCNKIHKKPLSCKIWDPSIEPMVLYHKICKCYYKLQKSKKEMNARPRRVLCAAGGVYQRKKRV